MGSGYYQQQPPPQYYQQQPPQGYYQQPPQQQYYHQQPQPVYVQQPQQQRGNNESCLISCCTTLAVCLTANLLLNLCLFWVCGRPDTWTLSFSDSLTPGAGHACWLEKSVSTLNQLHLLPVYFSLYLYTNNDYHEHPAPGSPRLLNGIIILFPVTARLGNFAEPWFCYLRSPWMKNGHKWICRERKVTLSVHFY